MAKRWPIILIFILPLAVYWSLTIGGRVLYWGLPLYQFYPWHTMVAEAVRTGNLPLWTDLLGNGAPLLANHQSAFFYPLNLIYLVMPAERAAGYSVVLHLILAGLFAYAWGRAIALSRFGAAVVGLSFMLSGFFVSRTQFISVINGAAWLPLLFLLAERMARRLRPMDALGLGLAWALQFLAGHAQLWFYSLWAVGAYTVVRTWWVNRQQAVSVQGSGDQVWKAPGRVLILLVVAFSLSLGLSAVQLLPTAELALQSQRAGGLDPEEAMTYSMWPWRLLTIAIPDLFGSPAAGDYWGYATYWEDAAYAGLLPLLLAFIFILSLAKEGIRKKWRTFRSSLDRRPVRPDKASEEARLMKKELQAESTRPDIFLVVFFLLQIFLALLLAMGKNTPIYPLVFKYIPGFGLFRAPARFLLFYSFGVSTLAGLAADQFRLTYRTQYVLRLTVAGAGAMLVVSLLMGNMDLPIKPTFAPAIARFAVWLALSALVLLLCPVQARRHGQQPQDVDRRVMRSPLSPGLWRGLVVSLIALDLALFAAPLTPTIEPGLYRVATKADRFLLARADDDRLFATWNYDYNIKFNRYLDFGTWGPSDLAHWLSFRESLVPNLNVLTHTPGVNNDEPLVVGRWRELMDALKNGEWSASLRLLRMMNVGYVLADSSFPGLSPVEDIPGLYRLSGTMHRAWLVPRARVISNPGALLAELMDDRFDPASEVLLETGETPPSQEIPQGLKASLDSAPGLNSVISLREEINSRTLEVVNTGLDYLVLSYTYYPGWHAAVDGQPADIIRANYAFMALPLEPGRHQVELHYWPATFQWGVLISGLVLLAVIGALVLYVSGRTRDPAVGPSFLQRFS